jgi:NAD(P)-dependent dehydrogenase (short-subunit alcohol dehydrogenase family)
LGAAIARAALAAGHAVVATGRDAKAIERELGPSSPSLLVAELDVTDQTTVDRAVERALERFGGIDVLVNNAGFAQLGAFEDIAERDVRAQFETNVFGTMNVTRAVLPGMRGRRSGRILNVSSMAGYIGGSHYSVYAASKFAIEGFSESLSAELAPLGILVTLVEPYYFRTEFLTRSVRHGTNAIEEYRAETETNRAGLDARSRADAGDPVELAAALLALCDIESPPVRYPVGGDAIAAIIEANAVVSADIGRFADDAPSKNGSS